MTTVRTRFAPSPTGYLHIGGVRTALFCRLFAKNNHGQFILRIDDTDQQRNVEEALQPILDGLRWLGIDWDEGPIVGGQFAPYYQSQRSGKYQQAVDELLRRGFAYRDYSRPEEIQRERDAATAEKRTFVYSRRWMAETNDDANRFEQEGRSYVVRLKMPRDGQLVLNDHIRGHVAFDWANEQDHVIQRADGSCLYHLANVVDDQELQITHVIRAEEHLSNTPRQVFIIQSLGYNMPEYAHLPFVAEPGSKTKLSKRKLDKYLKNRDFANLVEHGQRIAKRIGLEVKSDEFNPVIIDFYEKIGFLPEAIVNYLALLGWSLDDKSEFFTPKELTELFSLERVTKAAASFDPQKLLSFQEKHIQTKTTDEKYALCIPFLQKANYIGKTIDAATETLVKKVIEAAGDRIKLVGDILDFDEFFTPDDQLNYDKAAYEKRIANDPAAVALLEEFCDKLAVQNPFDTDSLDKLLHAFIEEKQIKIGQIIHALRVAVTGKSVGVGMFDILAILGKEKTIWRIKNVKKIA
ncbi:MAG: glutamate--tRNA ligase [Planctomycetaceae bacterium]|jgi:glutamyl-tRNA synthetase|nr:glutamate--tRNA ligase [Planctomycetaceae bacterium]